MTTTTSGPSLFTSHLSWARAKFVSLCLLSGEDCWKEEDLQKPGTLQGRGRSLALSRGQRRCSRDGVGRGGRWECEAVLRMRVPSSRPEPRGRCRAHPLRQHRRVREVAVSLPQRAGPCGCWGPLRAGPPASWYRCSDSSVVCSEHFAPVCFDVSSVIQKNLRFSERLRPVAGAVSILHPVASLLKPKGKEEETERAAGEGRKAPGSQAAPGYPKASLLYSPLARQEGFRLRR